MAVRVTSSCRHPIKAECYYGASIQVRIGPIFWWQVGVTYGIIIPLC